MPIDDANANATGQHRFWKKSARGTPGTSKRAPAGPRPTQDVSVAEAPFRPKTPDRYAEELVSAIALHQEYAALLPSSTPMRRDRGGRPFPMCAMGSRPGNGRVLFAMQELGYPRSALPQSAARGWW